MIEVFDNQNNLIAIIHKVNDFKKGKNFYTDKNKEIQFGSFDLKAGENIEYHIHNFQERVVNRTSEGIVVISGKIIIELFDDKKNLIHKQILSSGDAILIFEGGHGISILEDCKFLEFKQGPYYEEKDKLYFDK